jgi:hypothetical protein
LFSNLGKKPEADETPPLRSAIDLRVDRVVRTPLRRRTRVILRDHLHDEKIAAVRLLRGFSAS